MRTLILAAALLGAASAPSHAQDAPAADGTTTCAAFLALDAAGQAQAMLALRAAYNGEPVPEAAPAEGGTADGDAAAPDSGGAADAEAAAPEPADHKLTAMRTSCEGVPDALASDALLAAHADYE